MASPVEVFRNLSGMFSPQLPPSTTNSPKFSIFGSGASLEYNFRGFETPGLDKGKIPAAFSTPIQINHALKSARTKSMFSTSILGRPPLINESTEGVRPRRFGVSDITVASKIKSGSGNGNLNYAQFSTRTCNVFSASFTPYHSPSADLTDRKRLLRLSGIALSPSTVSWTSESPVLPITNDRFTSRRNSRKSLSSPSYFLWNKYEPLTPQCDVTEKRRRLHDSVENCPPGKLYFWEDDENEIITQDQLGRGGFGRVFEGTYRGQRVAIKKLETFKSRQALIETLQGELIGLRLHHMNVVRTLVVVQPSSPPVKTERNSCYVVMEHAGNRNLSQLINDPNELIPIQRSFRFAADILNALIYLHQKDLAHLDLKPSNVIVTSHDVCKICDFGSCQYLTTLLSPENQLVCDINSNLTGDSISSSIRSSASSSKSSSQLMGTFIYRAPELLRGLLPTAKSDMFSFSITAWQIWSRVLPYSGQHNHATVFAVVSFGARPQVPTFNSPRSSDSSSGEFSERKYLGLVQSCWAADPAMRPTAEKAYTMLMQKPNVY